MPKHKRFNVRPRYSAGSPGQVDEVTAHRVAEQEEGMYRSVLAGLYGQNAQERAKLLGRRGIAYELIETRKCWLIRDLITSEEYERPFDDRLRKDGWFSFRELPNWLQEQIEKESSILAHECQKIVNTYHVWFREPTLEEQHKNKFIHIWEPRVKVL